MGSKRKRNKLCDCGSSKLARNCCMDTGSSSHKKSAPIPEAANTIPSMPNSPQAEAMMEAMRMFGHKQSKKAKQGDKALDAIIQSEISDSDKFSALLHLGALSLLPDNQSMEMRLLSLGQKLVARSHVSMSRAIDLRKVCRTFDRYFGPEYKMAEIDTKESLYISWVKHNGGYYRVFTGTLAEGEEFLGELIWKYNSIKDPLPESLKGTDEFLDWFLQKMNAFIEDAGLAQYESKKGADYPNDKIQLDVTIDNLLPRLEASFVLEKADMPKTFMPLLGLISQRASAYSPDGNSDFYEVPVIEYDEHYAVPFPQLLIPSLFGKLFQLASEGSSADKIKALFREKTLEKISFTLKTFFGEGKVLEGLKLDSQDWSDFCVRYDGKLLFISVATSLANENPSEEANDIAERTFNLRKSFLANPSQPITSVKGIPNEFSEVVEMLEPIVITLADGLSDTMILGMSADDDDILCEVFSVSSFEYVIHHCKTPMEFIRFLRATGNLRKRKIRMPGATTLDLLGMYRDGTHQLRDLTTDPNMLLVDLTAGARLVSTNIRKERKKASLLELDGKNQYLRKHYNNFYGRVLNEVMRLHRLDSLLKVHINIPLPTKLSSKEMDHSVYLAFDSLAYFLDENIEHIQSAVPSLGDVVINVKPVDGSGSVVVATEKVLESGRVTLTLSVGEMVYKLFSTEDNSGERAIVRAFADAIEIHDSQRWVDRVKPLSSKRNFQSNVYYLSHKSYEEAPRPMRIEEGDRWWVDEQLAKSVLEAGIKPGTYTSSSEIGGLASSLSEIAKVKLQERLKRYSKHEIVQSAYTQLEILYANDERQEFETLANIAIRNTRAEIKRHTQQNQDFTQLSFAHRFLLESALQNEEEGNELLTEEAYLELVSLAERFVDIDFWGDTTYYGLQPGTLHISKGGYPAMASSGNGAKLSQKRAEAALKTTRYKAEASRRRFEEGPPKPQEKETELYEALNEPFKDEFGYTLEDFLDVGKCLIDFFNKQDSPIIMASRPVLISKVAHDVELSESTVTTVIENLTLSQETLKGVNIGPSVRFWREERLLNKPLVAMPRNTNILMFTRAVMERTFLSFIDRLMSGKLDYLKRHPKSKLSKVIMERVNADAIRFEGEVANVFIKKGIAVRPGCTAIGGVGVVIEGVGEIDALAWDEKKNTAYILEVKDNDPCRSPVEIKSEIDNYYGRDGKKGYYTQLGNKYAWVKENEDLLRKEFNINPQVSIKVKPMLITRSIAACSILKEPPFPTQTLDEFSEAI